MKSEFEIKNVVKEKYGKIAASSQNCGCSCCGTDADVTFDYTVMSDDYTKLEGYVPEADLRLGCGLPTEYAEISEGDTVLDLGSGAGNDVFVARRIVGDSGKVIGIDFTDEMLQKAWSNLLKTGYQNVEFRKGDIENMPIESNSIDVVISNCVLNLVPDKNKAFSEIYRVLKPGGHFCVSDIVIKGELPDKLIDAAAWYTGCVAGALQIDDYIGIIKSSGFKDTNVPKEKLISIPDEILTSYLDQSEINGFKESGTKILSVTVTAKKVIN